MITVITSIIVALGIGFTAVISLMIGYDISSRRNLDALYNMQFDIADAHRLRDGALADREHLMRLEALARGELYQADKERHELLDELSKAQARIVLFENGINHSTETEAAS